MRQAWRCEVCKVRGSVRFKKHAGVYEVCQLIYERHKQLSQTCLAGLRNLRVVS